MRSGSTTDRPAGDIDALRTYVPMGPDRVETDPNCARNDAEPPTDDHGEGPARLITYVTTEALAALEEITKLTGDSRTDSVNRALLLYRAVEQMAAHRGGTIVYSLRDGTKRRVDVT